VYANFLIEMARLPKSGGPELEERVRRLEAAIHQSGASDAEIRIQRILLELKEAASEGDAPRVDDILATAEKSLRPPTEEMLVLAAPARRGSSTDDIPEGAFPPSTRSVNSRSSFGAIRDLAGRVAPPPDTRRRILVGALLGAVFASILALAAQGRLLWGVDTIGIYSPQDFIYRPGVDVAIPSFVALLYGSNASVILYFSLAIEGAVAAYCAQILAYQFARGRFQSVKLTGAEIACAVLYLGNPFILSFGTTSILSNVLISSDALLAVIAILIGMIRDASNGVAITRSTAVWLGLAIGLASPLAFPNFLRIQLLILVALLVTAFYIFWLARFQRGRVDRPNGLLLRTFTRFLGFTFPIAALLLAYPVWNTLTTFVLPKGVITSIIASQPGLNVTQYNTMGFVIRLLGKGTLHAFSYASTFQGPTVSNFSSWLWPLFALGIPVIAILADGRRFVEWKVIGSAEIVAWLAIVWSCANNPPTGWLIEPLVRAVPKLPGAIPFYYLQFQVLSWLYPLLASVSVVWFGQLAFSAMSRGSKSTAPTEQSTGNQDSARRPFRRWRLPGVTRQGVISAAVPVCIVVLLLLVDGPVVTGQSLDATAKRTTPGGFLIPSEYSGSRSALSGISGRTLVLPGLASYFATSWNFYGGSSFYSLYYFPAQFVVPAYFGPFGILNSSNSRDYSNLTSVVVPSGNLTNDTPRWISAPKVVSTPYTLAFTWHPSKTGNLSGQEWIGVTVNSNNSGLLATELGAGDVWFGVLSVNGIGDSQFESYNVISRANTIVTNLTPGAFRFDCAINFPNTGNISPERVVGLRIWFHSPLHSAQISLSLADVALWSSSEPSTVWRQLIAQYDVSTILLDTTVNYGLTESIPFAKMCLTILKSLGVVTPVWSSTDLTLFRVDSAVLHG